MAKGMLGGTWESANIRVQPTGEVEVSIGSTPHEQSHETTFAQVVAEELGGHEHDPRHAFGHQTGPVRPGQLRQPLLQCGGAAVN